MADRVRRTPWLTAVVTVVTAVVLVVQETVPGTLGHLERTPAALHGDVWRWVTSLVVQDGHWAGGVFNLLGLVLCGTAAEQAVGRRAWLAAYVGAGLVGQVFGQVWQPVGGGNSVAVCGLAALCAAAAYRLGPATWPLTVAAPLFWCGALAAGWWAPLLYAGALLGLLASGPGLAVPHLVRTLVPTAVAAAGLVLLLDTDIHGGALTVALVVALPLAEPLAPRLPRPVE